MEKLLKTGPVVIKLRDFSTQSPWSLWQWKLEPFATNKNLISHIDISFGLSQKPGVADVQHSEKSGFYKRCVYSCTDGKELHTLEDKEKTVIAFSKNKNCINLVTDETDSDLQAPLKIASQTRTSSLLLLAYYFIFIHHHTKKIPSLCKEGRYS